MLTQATVSKGCIHPSSQDQTDSIKSRIPETQSELEATLLAHVVEVGDAERECHTSELALKYVDIGKAYAKVKNIGEARLHFYVACLLVESAHREGTYIFNKIYFQYAKFLEANNWYAEALKIMERQLDNLAKKVPKDQRTLSLYKQIRDRAASLYLKNIDFEKAKTMYGTALSELQMEGPGLATSGAQYVERIAFAQVHQQEYETACRNYERLLNEQSPSSDYPK
ncbi:MAG: hypothetical protein Q9167_004766 [Letrouitia subvulpina]